MQTQQVGTHTRGDFVVLHLMQHLTATKATLTAAFASEFETIGKHSEKEFFVDSEAVGPGYLTIQTFALEPSRLHIRLNGKLLPLADLPEANLPKTWISWTEVIPESLLVRGRNVIRLETAGPKDSYLVRDIILHWHESEL